MLLKFKAAKTNWLYARSDYGKVNKITGMTVHIGLIFEASFRMMDQSQLPTQDERIRF